MRDESIFDLDQLNEECGVFAVFGHPEAARLTYYGLHALQHRGQESAGIVTTDGEQFRVHRGMGLVTEVFQNDQLERLTGQIAIGHVRYSTTGGTGLKNAQPLVFNQAQGELAIATNGNLVNAVRLRRELETTGSILQTTTDTEVIAHFMARSQKETLQKQVKEALNRVVGAYALLILTNQELIVALDPHGLRPLSLGMLEDAYIFSSETCAFEVVGAKFIREIQPGELLVLNREGMVSTHFTKPQPRSICSFEYIYFARPDSDLGGINIHQARKRLGKKLYEEAPVEADVVTGVPDSSISAAIGFAEAAQIPYELGLIKNRYVGRTFIQPTQELREQGVRMKLNAVREVVAGKRVVMVDDSIVRGTTSRRIVNLLREAGAIEVHIRVSSPPVIGPCFYGIDIADKKALIAANHSLDEMCKILGADSLSFLSVEGMLEAIGRPENEKNRGHCLACFTEQYPTLIEEENQYPMVLGGER
ncbi:amidophosphoribosyltransferase [Thermoflavimicrobium daqui]|jgi:amidophosphoribosyltransferase|uniref:Amidophosphoribosyltransferase n=1 Tax=Thermoflavimicrobium daqui TaxID=2137476 RepID=A0A364K1J8_9BACL|nr:amidophosphoribosyltransferase [Thermoflavimicrobium daqui]RAL21463.1 amidophosphoribosyltransferase [Thermoflavimicrobium daqui]